MDWIFLIMYYLVYYFSFSYLEMNLSLVNPTDDHVGTGHSPIPGEPKADGSKGSDLDLKGNVLGSWAQRPEKSVVRAEIS